MTYFTNKVTMITGAGSGIGKALGQQLIELGAVVVLVDIHSERIKSIADSSRAAKDRVRAVQLDVRKFADIKKLIEETVQQHGRLDYIFNNAGIVIGGEVRDCSIDDWRAVMDVNLMGVVNGVAAAYPVMVSQGHGHIVNTGSIEGLLPFPGTVSYVASKFGVVGLSRALRIEGKGLGVKVSVVCPGYIKTQIFYDAKLINLDREKIMGKLPDKLAMTPEKCARKILKGVRRNKGLIVITESARIGWWLQTFFPRVIELMMQLSISKSRREYRIDS